MTKPRSRIEKGRAEQRYVLEQFKDCFNLTADDARTAIGAENGCDIKFTSKAQALVGLSVEVKNVRNLNLWSAFNQAENNCIQGTSPALIVHRSIPGNRQRLIVVPLEHYLNLRRQLLVKN